MRSADLSRIAELGAALKAAEERRDAAKAELDAADKELRVARKALSQLVTDVTEGDDPSSQTEEESGAAEDTEGSLTDRVKEWFEENRGTMTRAADLVEAGIGTNADSLRSTMHRLYKEGYLTKPSGTKGRYVLPPKHSKGVISIGGSAA